MSGPLPGRQLVHEPVPAVVALAELSFPPVIDRRRIYFVAACVSPSSMIPPIALSLFDQATDAVQGDEILAARVWMARRVIDFAWMDRYDQFQRVAL